MRFGASGALHGSLRHPVGGRERHGFQTPAAVRQNQLSPAVMAA